MSEIFSQESLEEFQKINNQADKLMAFMQTVRKGGEYDKLKQLFDMDYNERVKFCVYYGGYVIDSIISRVSCVNMYMYWLQDKNIISKDIKPIYAKDITNTDMTFIFSPNELLDLMSIAFQDIKEDAVSNFTILFFMLLFCGIPKSQCLKLKKSDFDFSRNVITFNGYEYKIYDEFVNTIKYIIQMTSYTYITGHYQVQMIKELPQSDFLFAGINSRSIYRQYEKKYLAIVFENKIGLKKIDYDITVHSGIFLRAYEEQQTNNASFYYIYSRDIEKYKVGNKYNSYRRVEYENWKRQYLRRKQEN